MDKEPMVTVTLAQYDKMRDKIISLEKSIETVKKNHNNFVEIKHYANEYDEHTEVNVKTDKEVVEMIIRERDDYKRKVSDMRTEISSAKSNIQSHIRNGGKESDFLKKAVHHLYERWY